MLVYSREDDDTRCGLHVTHKQLLRVIQYIFSLISYIISFPSLVRQSAPQGLASGRNDSDLSKLPLSLAAPMIREGIGLGGGGLTRVQSDALPLTLHADKLTVPDPSDAGNDQSDLSDFNSIAVEIGSSLDSLSSSKVSLAVSHQSSAASLAAVSQRSISSSALGSHGELHAHIPRGELRHHKQQSDDSFISSVLAPSRGGNDPKSLGVPVKRVRPGSAPTRATSDSILPPPLASSSSSSYASDSPKILKFRKRRTSTEDEKQKRLANIAESARAALTFTAIHRSKKTESLPRDHLLHHSRNHPGSKSVGSEEEMFGSSASGGSSNSVLERGTQTAADVKQTNSASPSPSFNLNNLSMDETRKASMNEMEEIWKLVENESGSSSSTSAADSSGGGGGGVGGGVGGGGGNRGPPSIALERHLSPQHTSRSEQKTGRRAMNLGPASPARGAEHVNGVRKGDGVVRKSPRHAALDLSEDELFVEGGPLQSTPKKPGLTASNRLPLPSGKQSSLDSRKGESANGLMCVAILSAAVCTVDHLPKYNVIPLVCQRLTSHFCFCLPLSCPPPPPPPPSLLSGPDPHILPLFLLLHLYFSLDLIHISFTHTLHLLPPSLPPLSWVHIYRL